MQPNPLLGVLLHAIGGLMSAIFCLPFRYVRHWAWESYWLVGGVFSWLIAPWCIASLTVPDLLAVLRESPTNALIATFLFGVLWGIGGLMFGLTVRYLGFALGTAMALGYCAAFGTLMVPWYNGKLSEIVTTSAGLGVLAGVAICMVGIVLMGIAGHRKEIDLSAAGRTEPVGEFNFRKGVAVATVCGITSACMAYAFDAGKPIGVVAEAHGAAKLWLNMPVLIVVLAGGFATNLVWCVGLNLRNGTGADYLRRSATVVGNEPPPPVPMLANYFFAALAGTIWYFQFFFYSMGSSQMGRFEFSSWTLHMSSIIIFGTLVGVMLSEWKGARRRTLQMMLVGLSVLVASTVVIGVANSYAAKSDPSEKEQPPALSEQ